MGHIELSQPVYNASLFTLLVTLLKRKCFSCHRLRISASRSRVLKVKLMLLSCGRLKEALELDARLMACAGAAAADPGPAAALAEGGGDGADAEDYALAAELARQERMLSDLEAECTILGGEDVGCGLGTTGTARFAQQLRLAREGLLKDFLAAALTRVCANCTALPMDVRRDGSNKLFRKRLSHKAAASMREAGIRYRSALGALAASCVAATSRRRAASAPDTSARRSPASLSGRFSRISVDSMPSSCADSDTNCV
jgi:DNA-directed RNA polymerase I subunit RPA1